MMMMMMAAAAGEEVVANDGKQTSGVERTVAVGDALPIMSDIHALSDSDVASRGALCCCGVTAVTLENVTFWESASELID